MLQRKVESGRLEPLYGTLKSAYHNYQIPVGRIAFDQTLSREETMPKYTHVKTSFQGTLDHLFYNDDMLEVVELLDIPNEEMIRREKAIPSTMFPSDHFRIEAVFEVR